MISLLMFFVLAFWGALNGVSDGNAISYQIKPVPASDRTNLEIAVQFKAENSNAVKVMLPQDCFGMPDIHRFVTKFEGNGGTSVQEEASSAERMVKPDPSGNVSLRYRLSFDPVLMDEYPYAPHTSATHFHLAGCQYLLSVAGLSNGMEFVAIDNSNRFGNGWSAKKPMTVTVKIEGQTCRFDFFPHGAAMRLKLFH